MSLTVSFPMIWHVKIHLTKVTTITVSLHEEVFWLRSATLAINKQTYPLKAFNLPFFTRMTEIGSIVSVRGYEQDASSNNKQGFCASVFIPQHKQNYSMGYSTNF